MKKKVFIITLDEYVLTGTIINKIIVGVYLKPPTLDILDKWAKEYSCSCDDFKVEENFLI
jgi:hypothetical protein